MVVVESMLDLVGATPVVRLKNMHYGNVEIYAKLEDFNPSGSVKDRAALEMVNCAERDGLLDPGSSIVEATSGNTGIALAMIAAVRGYHLVLYMPENMSQERIKMLRALGAELRLTPKEEGVDGSILRAEKAVREENMVMLDQYRNECNTLAHYLYTADEIIADFDHIDVLVIGVGTGGTITGLSKRLKEAYPDIKVIGVQPKPDDALQGLKNLEVQAIPDIYSDQFIDRTVYVGEEEAFGAARLLAKKEGILAGISSGAALHTAMQVTSELERSKGDGIVLTLFPDGGEKYLSTPLFGE